ncbi:O-methyltransferase [uncultured Treponema sp.]|uniref:O-methyltransferase n=1 Tax=uncultured Treponema sp. TaxID=162155 RepID=UPI0025941ED2|nr:O-methyltransferase [uncultured Treponema sp.]
MEDISEIKEYAKKNSVPILRDGGDDFICNYIKQHNIKNILEIGTAIGYSAIRFAECAGDIHVTTIEMDIDRVIRAIQNIEDMHLQDRITVIHADALLYNDLKGKFDLIFIDAAKAQYIRFFEKYKSYLAPGGVIVSDNLAFHGMVEDLSLTHNYSTIKLVKKIRKYVDFLKQNKEFRTDFYSEGDGISVSCRAASAPYEPALS